VIKIIQVYQTNPFEDGQGGGVRYVKNLLNGIKGNCSEILFIGVGAKYKKKDNIELLPITKDVTGYIKFLFLLILKLPFIDLSKYEIVHVHRLYFAIPFILLKPKLKIVCSLHGRTFSVFESNNGNWKLKLVRPFFMIIEKFSIKHIDCLVPVSQDVVNTFQKKYNKFANENIEIIGSMLFLDKFTISNSSYLEDLYGKENVYVLFIGRLSDVKDVEFLIDLWSQKFEFNSRVKLIVAGDGENKRKLIDLSNKMLHNKPIFLGEINPGNIPKLIASSNMTILASKHEASPTVVKESIASGIPIVSSRVGDVEDYIIDGKNGYVVDKNFPSYFRAIMSLINKPLSKEGVRENSNKQLKKCSVGYVSGKYMSIYRRLEK